MPARAFLFDIGNVLVRFDFGPAIRRLAKRSRADEAEINSLLLPFKEAHERGHIGDSAFVARAIELIGFQGSAAEFTLIWNDIFTENTPMLRLVRRLAGQHRLLHLSNTSGLHKGWLAERFDFFPLFEGGSYSHEVGEIKPHDAIYRHALETFGLDPARTFYVDDLLPNILTGKRFGLNCHHYDPDDHAAFEQAVNAWLG